MASKTRQTRSAIPALYRQGDVGLERIHEMPSELTPVAPKDGAVILAFGEVSFHHHSFAETEVQKLTAKDGAEFFRVSGRLISGRFPLVRRWRNQVMVNLPSAGLVEFAASDVVVGDESVTVAGSFGLLQHQEHTAHAIPAGLYRGAGATGTVRQREYSPAGLRPVSD